MAIRIKNLDLGVEGMRRSDSVFVGDVTADATFNLWIAPVACVVDSIAVVSTQACPPATTTASTTASSMTYQAIINTTASVMAVRGNSATETTTNSISANVAYVTNMSANNSLTQGSVVQLIYDTNASGALSQAVFAINYRPLLHRETR